MYRFYCYPYLFALIDDEEDEMEEDIGLSSGEEDTTVLGVDGDDVE